MLHTVEYVRASSDKMGHIVINAYEIRNALDKRVITDLLNELNSTQFEK